MAQNFDTYIRQFLEYLEIEKGRAHNTIRNYDFYLHRFAEWSQTKGVKKPQAITAEHMRKYRLWLNRIVDRFGEPLKKNTQNYHLIAVRAFLKFLSKRDIAVMAPEKIELAKVPQRQVEFLDGTDLAALLEAPLGQKRPRPGQKPKQQEPNQFTLIQLRDKSILELLFSTGLRVSECARLKIENINLKKDEFTVRGKGSKLRLVFLSESAKYWIGEYLKKRHDMNPYLFVSHDRAAAKRDDNTDDVGLTPRSIQRILEKYTRQAGITKKVTPHTLRHSYATDLLINGADIRSVQAMLGHESILTTQVYTHVTDQQLRKVHKNFHNKKN
jgi:site-specific recombinase XerD